MRRLIIIYLLIANITTWAQTNVLLPADENGKWGYINKEGAWVISPRYDACLPFKGADYSWAKQGNKSFLIDRQGSVITQIDRSKVVAIHNDIVVYQEDVYFGWYQKNRKTYVPARYLKLNLLETSGYLAAMDTNGLALINDLGQEILNDRFTQIEEYGSYIKVFKDSLVGLYKPNVGMILPIASLSIDTLNELLVVIDSTNRNGLYTKNGERFFGQDVHAFYAVTNTLYALSSLDKCYLLNTKTLAQIDSSGMSYSWLGGPNVIVQSVSGKGLFNTTDERLVMPPEYEQIAGAIGNDDIFASKNSLFAHFDYTGKQYTEHRYSIITSFDSFGLSKVMRAGKWGILNRKGEEIISCLYRQIVVGTDQSLKIYNNGMIGLFALNEQCSLIDSVWFDNVGGIALQGRVSMNMISKASVVDPSGAWFQDAGGLWGLRGRRGEVMIPAMFNSIQKVAGTSFVVGSITRMHRILKIGALEVSTTSTKYLINEDEFRIVLGDLIYLDEVELANTRSTVVRSMERNGRMNIINKATGKVNYLPTYFIGPFSNGRARYFVHTTYKRFRRYSNRSNMVKICSAVDYAVAFDFNCNFTDIQKIYGLEAKGYWAFINETGRPVISNYAFKERAYHNVTDMHNNSAVFTTRHNKFGMIDRDMNVILPDIYDDISFLPGSNDSLLKVSVGSRRYGYVSKEGIAITPVRFTETLPFSGNCAWAFEANNTYLVKMNGTILSKNGHSKVTPFSEGYAGYATEYQFQVVDSNLVTQTGANFIRVGKMREGLMPAKRGGRYGYINAQGKMVIDNTFLGTEAFHNGYAVVKFKKGKKRLLGVINKEGTIVYSGSYRTIYDVDENGYFELRNSNREYGLAHVSHGIVIPVRYKSIIKQSNQVIAVSNSKTKIYELDSKGVYKRLFKVNGINKEGFCDDVLLVKKGKTYGIVDRSGGLVLRYSYRKLAPFENGISATGSRRYTYVINLSGDTLCKVVGGAVGGFNNGLLLIRSQSSYFYVNQAGKRVFDKSFEQAVPFANGRAIVKWKGNLGVFDKNGFFIILPQYDEILEGGDGNYIVSEQTSAGIVNNKGEMLLPTNCDDVELMKEDEVYSFVRNNQIGYFDLQGKLIRGIKD
ncbi:MAG: hypothetical protein ACI8ZN_000213 [Bacteroidia bacterium]|jgi:hypothetical protein